MDRTAKQPLFSITVLDGVKKTDMLCGIFWIDLRVYKLLRQLIGGTTYITTTTTATSSTTTSSTTATSSNTTITITTTTTTTTTTSTTITITSSFTTTAASSHATTNTAATSSYSITYTTTIIITTTTYTAQYIYILIYILVSYIMYVFIIYFSKGGGMDLSTDELDQEFCIECIDRNCKKKLQKKCKALFNIPGTAIYGFFF